jgi:hypothetical protein
VTTRHPSERELLASIDLGIKELVRNSKAVLLLLKRIEQAVSAPDGSGGGVVRGRTYIHKVAEEATLEEPTPMWNCQLTSTQFAAVSIGKLVDADGREVTITGTPTWETSDPNVATIAPEPDGMHCKIYSGPEPGVGGFGAAIITTKADTNGGPWQEIGEVIVGASGDISGAITVESVEEEVDHERRERERKAAG